MTRVVVILCFAMAFAAGLLVGRQTRQQVATGPGSGATTRPDRPSRGGGPAGWLERELGLNSKQRATLEKIWSQNPLMSGRERDDRRRQLRRERDEAIAALVPPEHYGKYDQILKHYFDQTDAIDREARAAFDEAVRQTKEILTSQQRAKYEELLKRHQPPDRDGRGSRDKDSDREPGGPPDQHGPRGDAPRATTRPATAPNASVAPIPNS
jgi:hypothetical protein